MESYRFVAEPIITEVFDQVGSQNARKMLKIFTHEHEFLLQAENEEQLQLWCRIFGCDAKPWDSLTFGDASTPRTEGGGGGNWIAKDIFEKVSSGQNSQTGLNSQSMKTPSNNNSCSSSSSDLGDSLIL